MKSFSIKFLSIGLLAMATSLYAIPNRSWDCHGGPNQRVGRLKASVINDVGTIEILDPIRTSNGTVPAATWQVPVHHERNDAYRTESFYLDASSFIESFIRPADEDPTSYFDPSFTFSAARLPFDAEKTFNVYSVEIELPNRDVDLSGKLVLSESLFCTESL